ncbi:uncharacterized protein N7496_001457 [Penicillium cataractarum]|uniref:Methyltransferase n=1 Tax=Penicillium cataractarum TaxID=2100454 RepID=A0A9W9VWF0_9EURO|nr:uncharacterized protein N7496_001457 [Penicillium cataractarum]KAJ5390389.1 hypothetical protein N7496_001457 [Penicillium cataractarum]
MSTTTTTTTSTITATRAEAASDYIPRGPTTASLTFYAPPADNSAPFNYVESPPEGQPQRNYGDDTQVVSLTDIRGTENIFTLDKDSFQALQNIPSTTTYATFDSETSIREKYYPEVEALLLQHIPNAHKIILFDHTIRRAKTGAPRQPVNRVHVDQTAAAALARVNLHITDEAEAKALAEGRYRIVNVWRPLSADPVQSSPLAFASAQSVEETDLVAVQHRYPNRNGETMGVKFNPGQRWFYWSGMTGSERLLLKCSDSKGFRDGDVAQWVPHTAFTDVRTPEGARPRESIEVRALVFG